MRRAAHEGLHKAVTPRFHPTQQKEATILASEILATPHAWDDHLKRAATSVIASIIYDTPTLKTESDPLVKDVNEFTARLTKAALPGAHLVESFPWLKYVPASYASLKLYDRTPLSDMIPVQFSKVEESRTRIVRDRYCHAKKTYGTCTSYSRKSLPHYGSKMR